MLIVSSTLYGVVFAIISGFNSIIFLSRLPFSISSTKSIKFCIFAATISLKSLFITFLNISSYAVINSNFLNNLFTDISSYISTSGALFISSFEIPYPFILFIIFSISLVSFTYTISGVFVITFFSTPFLSNIFTIACILTLVVSAKISGYFFNIPNPKLFFWIFI